DEQADLEQVRAWIEQQRDALACGELPLAVLALDPVRTAALAQPLLECADFCGQRPQARTCGRLRLRAHDVLPARCPRSAKYARTKSIGALVGVPGPNSLPTPCASSAAMSSSGMMPPPITSTWSIPCCFSSSSTRGNSVMCAPERTDSATTSTSSWTAAFAIISGV